ncbi:hypothetical protein [Saccharopolyspora spinosa]|uniref:hypothetical protein n=1 Tax=Saccharopolyspora spinosa TaxID=60894 RepID=UPI001659736B|nr:hypothetical protein [Saccharopolyspora spinosa]
MTDYQEQGEATHELAGFAGLQTSVAELSQQWQQADSDACYTGHDETGLIGITVDGSGLVRAVDVDSSWRRAIDPRSFDDAVLQAWNAALVQRATSCAQVGGPSSAHKQHPSATEGAGTEVSEPSSHQAAADTIAEILGLLENFNRDLADYEQQLRKAAARPVSGHSAGGNVTVSMANAQPTGVEVNANWVAGARPAEINTEVLSALEAAQTASRDAQVSPETFGRSIGRLHQLTSNPNLLMRRLGLIRE